MAAAPSSSLTTSSPMTTAGSRPTALRTEISPAHALEDGEDVRAAQGRGQIAEPAGLAGHRHDAAAQLRFIAAARLPQGVKEDTESDGRLQRAAALADDHEPPTVVAGEHVQQAAHRVVVDIIALEIDPRPVPAGFARKLVVIGMAAGLEQRPRPHVRPADTQNHHAIDLGGQPIAGGDDAVEQGAVFVQQPLGQVEESGVQRLIVFRHRSPLLEQHQIIDHQLPCGGQAGSEPAQVGLGQGGLANDGRGVGRKDQRGKIVLNRSDGVVFHCGTVWVRKDQKSYPLRRFSQGLQKATTWHHSIPHFREEKNCPPRKGRLVRVFRGHRVWAPCRRAGLCYQLRSKFPPPPEAARNTRWISRRWCADWP